MNSSDIKVGHFYSSSQELFIIREVVAEASGDYVYYCSYERNIRRGFALIRCSRATFAKWAEREAPSLDAIQKQDDTPIYPMDNSNRKIVSVLSLVSDAELLAECRQRRLI